VIFRYNPNGQEAVVPLESRDANAYILAFDNTAGTATGIAINSVSTQAVNIPVTIRDDTGGQIGTDTISLAANGHLAFTLAAASIRPLQIFRALLNSIRPPALKSVCWGSVFPLRIRSPLCQPWRSSGAVRRQSNKHRWYPDPGAVKFSS